MGFFRFLFGLVQALLTLRRKEVDSTSYVSDYLTRSVRRASGFVVCWARSTAWR